MNEIDTLNKMSVVLNEGVNTMKTNIRYLLSYPSVIISLTILGCLLSFNM